jgi:hypothetical protein
MVGIVNCRKKREARKHVSRRVFRASKTGERPLFSENASRVVGAMVTIRADRFIIIWLKE